MSRYLFGTLLGLLLLFVLSSNGSLLRIQRGDTASREDDTPAIPLSSNTVATELTDVERAGQLVIRQTSEEARQQIAQRQTTPPEPEATQAPVTPTPTQTVEPAPQTSSQNNRRAIPALW